MTESPLMDSSFDVPVFSPRDDPIACLNKAMAFLTAVASSSCNKFMGGQGQSYWVVLGSKSRSNASFALRGKQVIMRTGKGFVLNKLFTICQGDGHMARQCTQPKRPRNATWYKEKAMLAEA
ncbi:hypothetical protein Tco_0630293 [Tanacetum coccineum]